MSDVKKEDVEFGKEPTGDNKKKIAMIGGIVAAVVVVLFVLISLISGGYKSPIKNYFNGLQKCNSKTYLKAFPEFMKDDLEDKYTDEYLEDRKESMEDTYGDKVKYSYKIVDKTKMTKDEIKDAKKALEKMYKDEKINLKEGYQVCVKVTVKGSDKKATSYTTFEVYKLNGKWVTFPTSL